MMDPDVSFPNHQHGLLGNQNRVLGTAVPVVSLCLLAPPLRLMSAAMWKVMLQRDVSQYGRLEEFVSSVYESVPGLLEYRHYIKLALGLRSRLILELFRGQEAPDPTDILAHLKRVPALVQSAPNRPKKDVKVEMTVINFQNLVQTLLDDPKERDFFFQEDFPHQYGLQYDKALEKLMWEFLTRLDQLLPVPDLAQTVSWLGNAPAFLDECAKSASQPQLLRHLLQHEVCLGHIDSGVSIPPTAGDVILSSLSLPPSGQPQKKSQPGSAQTSVKTTASDPSPQTSGQRRQGRAQSAINPVIGSISLKDIQSDVTGALLEENRSRPEVTSQRDIEPASPAQVFTKIKLRSRGRSAKAARGEEDCVRRDEPIVALDKEVGRVTRRRGRSSLRAQKEEELKEKERAEKIKSQENKTGDGVFTRVTLQEKGSWTSVMHSCLKRQPRVVIQRLDLTAIMKQRDSGVSDVSQKKDDSTFALSCSKRQLRIVHQRLDVSSPAVQALSNRPEAVVPECKKRSLSTRKRKRRECSSSPEKTLLSSENKENSEGQHIIFQRTNSPGGAPVLAEPSEEVIADSEDESSNSIKLFLKRYYRTKHNTLVPTLEEFLKPGLGRRDLLSPGAGHRQ